jgi:pyruvate, water dikinase
MLKRTSNCFSHVTNWKKILWFKNITLNDLQLVGTKNALLGETLRHLSGKGIHVPNGFAITSNVFIQHLKENNINEPLLAIHDNLDFSSMDDLELRCKMMQDLILSSKFSPEIEKLVRETYEELVDETGSPEVAVKSSSADYFLPGTSILNLNNHKDVMDAVIKCFASFFSPREMIYRETQGIDHLKYGISIGVQKMVNTSNTCCGEAFSQDIHNNFPDSVIVNGTFGIKSDLVDSGKVVPDEWTVFEKKLNPNLNPIIKKVLGKKTVAYFGGYPLQLKELDEKKFNSFCLTDEEVLKIAKDTKLIERFFSATLKKDISMEIEWALDEEKKINIVRAVPSNQLKSKKLSCVEVYKLKEDQQKTILVKGNKIGSKILSGKVCKISSPKDPNFEKNSIILTENFDRTWTDVLKFSSGVICSGGSTSSAVGKLCRENDVTCIVEAKNATSIIKDQQLVTMDCATTSEGIVFDSHLKYHIEEINCLNALPKIHTNIMINLEDYTKAFDYFSFPNDGVGLFTLQSIYNHFNISEEKMEPQHFNFVETISQCVAYAASAYYPKNVIVKLSSLDRDLMELECKILKRVKDVVGLSNILVQLPPIPQFGDCGKVLSDLCKFGLIKEHSWKFYYSASIPSNISEAKEIFQHVDGCIIDVDAFTELFYGIDPNLVDLSEIYADESKSIVNLLLNLIKESHENKKTVGIVFNCINQERDLHLMKILVKNKIDFVVLPPSQIVKAVNSIEWY